VIVDEGHRIKNMNCRLVRELKSLPSANRLLLTGTPLQNNLSELWSLLNFLLPDIFDDLASFQHWFDLGDLEDSSASTAMLLDAPAEVSIISNLHTILKPFLLRRLKSDVEKDLPPKKEYLIYCTLSAAQHQLYEAILAHHQCKRNGKTKEELDKAGTLVEGKKRRRPIAAGVFREAESDDSFTPEDPIVLSESEDDGWQAARKHLGLQSLQNALMQLRKVCNHPYLFDWPCNSDGESSVDGNLVTASGKMRVLDQLLPALLAKGHRVLIFSQMSRMLNILEAYLEFRGWSSCRLDGGVPQAERSARIAAFSAPRSPIPIFLLTTRAGGLGINLTAADTVIFFDSDWNPQMDLQARDRVHRIGQTCPVLVYRLAVAGSVECRILERAASKRRLERLVIHQKKFKGRQDLLEDGDDDDGRIRMEDLEAILKKNPQNYGGQEGRDTLSAEDLRILTDRSEATFATDDYGPSDAFRVLQEVRNEAADSLAK